MRSSFKCHRLLHLKRSVERNLNFYRLHLVILTTVPLIVAAIFYGSNGSTRISYTDSLFLCVSAVTGTGLNTVLLSILTTWQQVILFLLFVVGNPVMVSFWMLLFRWRAFKQTPPKRLVKDFEMAECGTYVLPEGDSSGKVTTTRKVTNQNDFHFLRRRPGRGSFPNPLAFAVHRLNDVLKRRLSSKGDGGLKSYLSFDAVSERNSNFQSLQPEQFEELRALEVHSMGILLLIIAAYLLIMLLCGVTLIAPYFASRTKYDSIFRDSSNLNTTWFSFFEIASMIFNCGMSLVDSSLGMFQDCYLLLIPSIFLMLGGYIGYIVVLRCIISLLARFFNNESPTGQSLRFLLDHPRRVYYFLFPFYETCILAFVVFSLVATDFWLLFALNANNDALYSKSRGQLIVDLLVQAVSIRSSGFFTVSESALTPSTHILNMFMIFITVYPLAMAIRATNVYEERAIGIYSDANSSDLESEFHRIRRQQSYVDRYLRDQLAYDMWFIIFAVWIICIVEREQLVDPSSQTWFTTFAVIYETITAYANCGLSLGLPYSNASFCGSFHKISKLVLMAAMIRGRLRSLPFAIDMAIMTPSQEARREHQSKVYSENGYGESDQNRNNR